jgi:hypothetical protein
MMELVRGVIAGFDEQGIVSPLAQVAPRDELPVEARPEKLRYVKRRTTSRPVGHRPRGGAARSYARKAIWRHPGHIPARQAVLAGEGHGRYNPRSPNAIPWDIDNPHRGMHRGAVPAD